MDEPLIVGRYALYEPIASGGMATVHLGRLVGKAGFARTVAIKRLHKALAADASFVAMLLDEAKLAARVRHPNVVAVLDVVSEGGEVFVVMEYVHGESLAGILRMLAKTSERIPLGVAVSIVAGALHGLHAAHEATTDRGEPLGIVHRDVSPHNLLVGSDGITRVADFGVAKAAGRLQDTRTGEIKGKLAYMAPEQLQRGALDRRVDIYAASVVLWEVLTGSRLFAAETEAATVGAVLLEEVTAPRKLVPGVPAELDEIVMKGLDRNPDRRFATALELALALEDAIALPREHEVGAWVTGVAAEHLSDRDRRLADVESRSVVLTLDGSATATLPMPRRRWVVPAGVLAGLSVVSVSVAVGLTRTKEPAPAALVAAAASLPSAPLASAAGSASGTPSASPTSPSASASASASAKASASVGAGPPVKRPAAPRTNGTVALPPPKANDRCEPPYVIDATGIKIPKPECAR